MAKHLIVLSGPTAVGKTKLSLELAKLFHAPIISADSRQIYKMLDIGTAKPSNVERDGINHFMIDHIMPDIIYSAGIYEREVIELLNELYLSNDVVILTGGTGLYIDAITEGLDEFPIISNEMRVDINTQFKLKGLESFINELQQNDPTYFKIVDLSNSRRVLRAIEVIRTSGKSYSSFLNQKKKPRLFTNHFIQLNRDRKKLYQRINQRVDEMILNGLVNEVRSLMPYRNYSSLDTVGYREIFDYLDGKMNLDEAVDEIKKHTRRYAKRQLTWFRKSDKWKEFQVENIESVLKYLTSVIPNQKEH